MYENNGDAQKSNIYYTFNDGTDKWSEYIKLTTQYDLDNLKSDLQKTFTTTTSGMVPAPGSGKTSYYLRGDGTWQSITFPSPVDVKDALTITSEVNAYNIYVSLLYSLDVYPSKAHKLKMSNGKTLCMFNINMCGDSAFVIANGKIKLNKTLEIVSLAITPTCMDADGNNGTGFAAIKKKLKPRAGLHLNCQYILVILPVLDWEL